MIHIKNVTICDGTGREPFPGELLLSGERIEAVSETPLGGLDAETIDGAGMTATPGFIDAHRHCDLAALFDPHFGELELAQGLTTVVMGNCGLAPTPSTPETRQALYDFIEPCLGKAPSGSAFPKVSDFLRALEGRPHPLNLGVLGATGAITTACKGYGDVPFTADTRRQAESYVRDAMEAGALGLSCGIMYTPECYSTTEDFVFLAKIAGEYGGYLTSHIRGEGNSLTQSVEEVLQIGRQAGVGVNISHFKVTGSRTTAGASNRPSPPWRPPGPRARTPPPTPTPTRRAPPLFCPWCPPRWWPRPGATCAPSWPPARGGRCWRRRSKKSSTAGITWCPPSAGSASPSAP